MHRAVTFPEWDLFIFFFLHEQLNHQLILFVFLKPIRLSTPNREWKQESGKASGILVASWGWGMTSPPVLFILVVWPASCVEAEYYEWTQRARSGFGTRSWRFGSCFFKVEFPWSSFWEFLLPTRTTLFHFSRSGWVHPRISYIKMVDLWLTEFVLRTNPFYLLFITCELILVILIIIVILRLRQQVERGMVTRLCRSGVCVGLLPITSFDLLFPAPDQHPDALDRNHHSPLLIQSLWTLIMLTYYGGWN